MEAAKGIKQGIILFFVIKNTLIKRAPPSKGRAKIWKQCYLYI